MPDNARAEVPPTGFDLTQPPEAPNACPECHHTPRTTSRCFGTDIECLDWRGRKVLCLCPNDVHFKMGSVFDDR